MKYKSTFSFRLGRIIKPIPVHNFMSQCWPVVWPIIHTPLIFTMITITERPLPQHCIPSHATPSLPDAPPSAGVRSSLPLSAPHLSLRMQATHCPNTSSGQLKYTPSAAAAADIDAVIPHFRSPLAGSSLSAGREFALRWPR